jgi:hypothetical protein
MKCRVYSELVVNLKTLPVLRLLKEWRCQIRRDGHEVTLKTLNNLNEVSMQSAFPSNNGEPHPFVTLNGIPYPKHVLSWQLLVTTA